MEYEFGFSKETKILEVKYAYVPPDQILVHTRDITGERNAEKAAKEKKSD